MKNISFSVVIPLKKDFNEKHLKRNINALSKQTHKPFEIILVHDSVLNNKPKGLAMRYTYIARQTTKSEARNLGARKARGTHIVHIDTDYVVPKNILKQAAEKLMHEKSDAVIMHETIKNPQSIWQEARRLEREIAIDDKDLCAPQIVSRKMFKKIDGFDEDVDELDDWALLARLRNTHASISEIKSPLTPIHEPTNAKIVFIRKFNKGRFLPTFTNEYTAPQISFIARASTYLDYLYHHPNQLIYSIPLLLLKIVDVISFRLGSYFPITQSTSMDTLYQEKYVAENFDLEQTSFYGKFKHAWEVFWILNILSKVNRQQSNVSILELGSGTGRITKVLIDNKYEVTPTDVSMQMLSVLKTKVSEEPIHLTSLKLPFKAREFDTVLAMRVIWHMEDQRKREKFFSEAVRVSSKYIIMDFALRDMGINSILKRDYFYTENEIKELATKHDLKIEHSYWLPMGRKLLMFNKK